MKMKRLIIELCCAIALVACGNSQEPKAGEEDLRAKSLLQGIWIEDETELPLMRIEGDTIYYTDPQNIPVSFKIIRDTMYVTATIPQLTRLTGRRNTVSGSILWRMKL